MTLVEDDMNNGQQDLSFQELSMEVVSVTICLVFLQIHLFPFSISQESTRQKRVYPIYLWFKWCTCV